MDKKEIIKAISNPDLVRRAITALRSDPGQLQLAYNAEETVYGRNVAYYLYHHGQHYIIAAECGSIVPMEAVVLSLDRATRAISQGGNLPVGVTVSCLAIVCDGNLESYCASRFPIIRERIGAGGTRRTEQLGATMGWFSLVLGADAQSMEEVISDMEDKLRGD